MLNYIGRFVAGISAPELIFFLIGAMLGTFYGLDGWRGSVKDVEFKNSPRVKNFIWVIALAFGTFIADIKRVDPDVNKEHVLVAYLVGFVICAVLVVAVWGFGIYVSFRRIRTNEPNKWPGAPFSPLADYLQYGYKYHREQYTEALERKVVHEDHYFRSFVPFYVKQISYEIAAVDGAVESPALRDVARNILSTICVVVVTYYGRLPDLEVNANYMVAYDPSALPELQSRLKCAFGDVSRYKHFLALEQYATDTDTADFVLPVEDKGDSKSQKRSLPGAPLAFLMNQTVIVDDVSKMNFGNLVPRNIKEEEQLLLEGKKFKSFGCLNILRAGRQLGIVNVESNYPHVFGKTESEKREITALLHPFCLLLGRVIKLERGHKNV